MYDDLPEKNGEDALNIKAQINLNKKEWETYNKNEESEDIEKENYLKQKINEKNIVDNILDNAIKKLNELIKDNEND